MGLSSLPTPSEGMLTVLLVNTALSVSVLKEILLRSVLRLRSPPSRPSAEPSGQSPELSLTDRFRSQFEPIRFGSVSRPCRRPAERPADCRVCLARFESESVVNRLPCGHLFHKDCLEAWLEYQHATCPLCRTHVFREDDSVVRPPLSLP